MQALDRKDATRDADSRRFLNKCHARGVLLLNRCILNLATRANPVGRVVADDKDVQERIVRRSKLEWVIVRPVILTDGPKTNAYRALADPRDWTCGFISRADVADFLIKQIDDDAFLYKTPVLMS